MESIKYIKKKVKSKAKSPNSADSQKKGDAQQNPAALVYWNFSMNKREGPSSFSYLQQISFLDDIMIFK